MQNLHTHTIYCDGADKPEDIILKAIEKGFDSLGFSGHSFMTYSPGFVKKGDKTEEYKREVKRLKEKYRDVLKIYLGLEVDMYSEPDMSGYDYLLGAVHYLSVNGEYIGFDKNEETVERIISEYFGGDGMKYAKEYYHALAQLPTYGDFDIIAHFDLITKHSENRKFFDTESKEYINYAIEAAEALAGKIPFFEVNTGAISRGFRKTPYPFVNIIRELKRLGFGAVITSDCHSMENLDFGFHEATELLKSLGFKEKYVLTEQGFAESLL